MIVAQSVGEQREGTAPPRFSFRAFGIRLDDLNIDFYQPSLPHLVTDILARCQQPPTARGDSLSALWNLSVGRRVEGLLHIVANSGLVAFSVPLACFNLDCRQMIEVDLSVVELSQLQRQAEAVDVLTITGPDQEVHLRRPTGQDQLDWQAYSFEDEQQAHSVILHCLQIEPPSPTQPRVFPDEWLRQVDEAMQEFDPLTHFTLTIHCPFCQQEHLYEVDLLHLALHELNKIQHRLLEEIHRLAFHYRWSEEQIVAIPSWRRASYLALLEGEKDR